MLKHILMMWSLKLGKMKDRVETFHNLRKFKIKLNPKKCTFSVPSGKLLGYMVLSGSYTPGIVGCQL
jgi:hypothetical protein